MVDSLAVWGVAVLASLVVVLGGGAVRRAVALRADPVRLAERLGPVARAWVLRRSRARWWGVPVVAQPAAALVGTATSVGIRLADRWPARLGRPRRLDRLLWAAALGASLVPARSVARFRRVS